MVTITEQRRVTVEAVERPRLSVRCERTTVWTCPLKFSINVCGRTETRACGYLEGRIILSANYPIGRLNVRIRFDSGAHVAFVALEKASLKGCPKGTAVSVGKGGSVDGVLDIGDVTYAEVRFYGFPVALLIGEQFKFTFWFWSDKFETVSCVIDSGSYVGRNPMVKFESINVPPKCYVNEYCGFNLSAKLHNCPTIDLLTALRKVSGPGKVYWRKKDGKWYEVTDRWTFDTILSGVRSPGDTGSYSGGLKFTAVGKYELVFGVGFRDYPTPGQVRMIYPEIEEIISTLEKTEVVSKEIVEKGSEKITLYTFRKKIEVTEPRKEMVILA